MRPWLLDQSRPFGKYKLLAPLGRGAMGEVWKVHDVVEDRIVALKVLAAGTSALPHDIRQFKREAQIAANLQHPSAIAIHEVDQIDGLDYFTMDWIEGDSLRQRVAEGPLDPDVAARYLEEAACLIAAAHAQGIIHRDLKPSNILIDRDDHARVTDFGLAQRSDGEPGLMTAHGPKGTPSYMSPEQASGNEVDARSDVYSLGATLYEVLTGHRPFPAVTYLETLIKVLQGELPDPRDLNRDIPRPLELICLKCLDKNPAWRYQTAHELADDLRRFREGEPVKARLAPGRVRLRRWAMRSPRTALASIWAAAFFLVILGVAVIFRQELMKTNAFAARGVASSLILRLRDWSDHLKGAVGDAQLVSALRARDPAAAQAWLKRWCMRGGSPNDSATLLDPHGIGLARCSPHADFDRHDFSARDYFRGALLHPQGDPVHVSAVYHSRVERHLPRFALSIAIRDDDGLPLGVLATSMRADDTLGIVNLQTEDQKVVVIGPLDTRHVPGETSPYPHEARGAIVVHPSYTVQTKELQWTNDWHGAGSAVHKLGELKDQTQGRPLARFYRDPMRAKDRLYSGPWLAGVAPIGHTGFVVLVQSRDWASLSVLGVLAIGGLGAAALALGRSLRRSRARRQAREWAAGTAGRRRPAPSVHESPETVDA
ncbi:MAG TPA: serine/threonine protein kinase [Polyangia bacterium]